MKIFCMMEQGRKRLIEFYDKQEQKKLQERLAGAAVIRQQIKVNFHLIFLIIYMVEVELELCTIPIIPDILSSKIVPYLSTALHFVKFCPCRRKNTEIVGWCSSMKCNGRLRTRQSCKKG